MLYSSVLLSTLNLLAYAKSQPNILLILTDQERSPPKYEPEQYKQYREQNFKARSMLSESGVEFKHHYVSSTACMPSRATLYTGQHIDLHGVDSTSGAAKLDRDPGLTFLDPNDVPTMGHYFRASGYDTYYFGKWHLSDEDITSGGNVKYPRKDSTLDEQYYESKALEKFGFSGWLGPEPHGPSYDASAFVNDQRYVKQVVDFFSAQKEKSQDKPWLLAVNLVNPHDIVYFHAGFYWTFGDRAPDGCPSGIVEEPLTAKINMSEKPEAYRQYVEVGNNYFSPIRKLFYSYSDEICFYYYLMKRVDEDIMTIYDALEKSGTIQDTTIMFTSDHGELLGSHGGAIQKWYNAYEESIHVPLTIVPAKNFPVQFLTGELSSHIDVLPTLLDIAGVRDDTYENIVKNFQNMKPLPGKSLVSNGNNPAKSRSVYFYTRDNAFTGSSALQKETKLLATFLNTELMVDYFPEQYKWFDAPWATNSVEAALFWYGDDLYKIVRHFDDSKLWSHPGENHTYKIVDGRQNGILRHLGQRGDVLIRTEPFPEEWELYNLSQDIHEIVNLADSGDKQSKQVFMHGKDELEKLRSSILHQRGGELPSKNEHSEYKRPSLIYQISPTGYYYLAVILISIVCIFTTLVSLIMKICKGQKYKRD